MGPALADDGGVRANVAQLFVWLSDSPASVCSWATILGSDDVTSDRHPPSMFTTSRVTLPLATAPRIALQSLHRCALSPSEASSVMRSLRWAIAACSA